MVSNADSALISRWLAQPHPLSPAESAAVDAMLQQWPWFTPARYLQAGAQQATDPFSPAMLGDMQLYAGNWLMFHRRMSAAAAVRELPPVTIAPVAAEPAAGEEAPATAPVAETPRKAIIEAVAHADAPEAHNPDEPLIQPVFTEDYFLHQGIQVEDALPEEVKPVEDPKSLMVVMSFTEWLQYFRHKSLKEKEEEEDKRALKSLWQKEKLAAALEEEDDEIPETVFEMAVNSINREDGLVSESLAQILVKQGKTDAAIDMYKKLSLRNPAKSAYFAAQLEKLQKEKDA